MRITTCTAVAGLLAALAAGCTSGGGTEAPGGGPAGSAAPAPTAAEPAPAEPVTDTVATPAAPARRRSAAATATGPAAPTRRPVIGRVWMTPAPACDPIWCRLPAGPGSVVVHADATGARSVEFFLVPTGTGTADLRRSLGVDRDGRDGWSVRWTYPDEPLLAHLTVQARGPGGSTDALPFNVMHPEPGQLGPTVGRVWTDPSLSCVDGWCRLPAATGTMTISAEIRDALGVEFWIDTVDSEPYRLDRPVRTGDRYSVRWTWAYQNDARLRIVAGNNLGQVSVHPLAFRRF